MQFRYYRNALSSSQGGRLPVSYQWQQRFNRWKQATGFFGGGGENQPRPKLCPACGTLVGISATRCHECGANLRFSLAALSKGLTGFFGGQAPATTAILVANAVMFAATVLVGLAGSQGREARLEEIQAGNDAKFEFVDRASQDRREQDGAGQDRRNQNRTRQG